MSRRVITHRRNNVDYIERMLNKTTLSTQRLVHENIIDLGSGVLTDIRTVKKDTNDKAVVEAVEAANARATRELRAALKRQKTELEDARRRAVKIQEDFYKKLSEKVQEQRDRLEKERMRELERKYNKDLDDAMEKQKEEMLRQQEEAVRDAVAAAKQRLYEELSDEHQKALNKALEDQADELKKKELAAIEQTKIDCAKLAAEVAAEVERQHREEIDQMKQEYNSLSKKFRKELNHKLRVEKDFLALQTDYKRFLDYTDGLYHSDFMMKLKHHGTQLASKRLSTVSHMTQVEDALQDEINKQIDDLLIADSEVLEH